MPKPLTRLALNVALPVGAAPTEVELISAADAAGRLQGRDGRQWLFDDCAKQQVLANFKTGGIELPIDWEHATQHRAPNGEEAPASGWIDGLTVRDGALWGSVHWTPRAAEQVLNREYRFLSPVFDYDARTGRIFRLVSAGLVNKPNLPLQALNHEEPEMTRSALLLAAITGALHLTEDASDDAVAQAVNALKADKEAATALNAQAPSLERFVPRADYDAMQARAVNAEDAVAAAATATHQAAVDTAIEGALADGKITPATADYHRAACADASGLARFAAFAKAAPAIAAPSGLETKRAENAQGALSADELAVCTATGVDPKAFAATKAA